MDNCIFCKIVKGEIPCEKVIESENFMVIKDANPQTEGHSLVIPKKHYETFLDIPAEIYQDFLDLTNKAISKIMFETNSEGYNLLMNNKPVAGQIVPHAHLHLLFRKRADGMKVGP
jgi:histidine triad (HIT) family protein